MNYKYVVFCPYFGTLPTNFNLWLKSCSYNKDFLFIVFTNDETPYIKPDNVKIVVKTFDEFREEIQNKFDFKISLENPYKLCDYKPTYGFVFEDYLNNCTYWGFCDLDLVFGNLTKFLPKEDYDKISFLGHFCLMKNEKKITESFKLSNKSRISYKDILSNNLHFGFDEIGEYGINNILKNNNFKIYNYEQTMADIDCRKKNLSIVTHIDNKFKYINGNRIFSFNEGKVFEHLIKEKQIITKEYSYIHFQKRKMNVNIDNSSDNFLITYNSFEKFEEVDNRVIEKYLYKKLIDMSWVKFRINGIKRRITRKIKINKIIKEKKNEHKSEY